MEVLSSWLALTDDAFVGELRQCLFVPNEIQQVSLPSDTAGRSARLFYLLQQALAKSVDQHVACVPWVVVLEREVKEHGNDDHSEPCVELVRGCATGGCDDDVSEPPKVNPHRVCALRGLPVVIPVPDEDEELIPASMPEPVGSREPPSGPGPELEQPEPDEDPEPELHVPLGDKEYQEHVARHRLWSLHLFSSCQGR